MAAADILVIGGGLAGWRAAEAAVAAGCTVKLVANGAGNSPAIHALNVPVLPEDSAARFMADTLASGHGANDPALVRVLCENAAALADEFPFDRNPDGSYRLLRPLGSSVPRCVSIRHAIGAWALAKIRRELAGRVETETRRVTALDVRDGLFLGLHRAVVLATGGWCGKYAFSTNPPELRGDGLALAQGLGAAVRDPDAVQYEPTAALAPARVRGIPVITTLLFEGAVFRNAAGAEFLPDAHADKDALSKAIFAEIARGGGVAAPDGARGVWFDATGVPEATLCGKYADTVARYAAAGVDIRREPVLVAPAPHTALGGVAIDPACRVLDRAGRAIPGLFAAGEVTGGLHGRNRLGGNAGTEVLVFGRIAGRSAAAYVRGSAESSR